MTVRHTIIVDHLSDWKWDIEGLNVITGETAGEEQAPPGQRIQHVQDSLERHTQFPHHEADQHKRSNRANQDEGQPAHSRQGRFPQG